MGHFAKVRDGRVVRVIVAEPEFFNSFVDDSPGDWIQTSYNTMGGVHYDPITKLPSEDQSKALRKNYAGLGDIYNKDLDAFYAPSQYESWTLDTETCTWQPPIPWPNDANIYVYEWNERLYQSDNTKGWIKVTL